MLPEKIHKKVYAIMKKVKQSKKFYLYNLYVIMIKIYYVWKKFEKQYCLKHFNTKALADLSNDNKLQWS